MIFIPPTQKECFLAAITWGMFSLYAGIGFDCIGDDYKGLKYKIADSLWFMPLRFLIGNIIGLSILMLIIIAFHRK